MSELLNKILDRENMNQAYQKVKANKGSAGIDEVSVEELNQYIKDNWKYQETNRKQDISTTTGEKNKDTKTERRNKKSRDTNGNGQSYSTSNGTDNKSYM